MLFKMDRSPKALMCENREVRRNRVGGETVATMSEHYEGVSVFKEGKQGSGRDVNGPEC